MSRIHSRNGGVAAPSARAPRATSNKVKVANARPARDLATDRHRDAFEPGHSRVRHGRHHHKHHGAIAHSSGDTSPIPPENIKMPNQILLSDTSPIPPDKIASVCGQVSQPTPQVQTSTSIGFGVRSYRTT